MRNPEHEGLAGRRRNGGAGRARPGHRPDWRRRGFAGGHRRGMGPTPAWWPSSQIREQAWPRPGVARWARERPTRPPSPGRCRRRGQDWKTVVPGEGVEPTLPCGNGILSPARLPVPPSGPSREARRIITGGGAGSTIAASGSDGRDPARHGGAAPGTPPRDGAFRPAPTRTRAPRPPSHGGAKQTA